MLRLLTFTTLYPNSEAPYHGVFVENRLRNLLATGEAESRVVAPVPYFPFRGRIFGAYGGYARVAPQERRYGITVTHPRYLIIPKMGMNLAPGSLAKAGLRAIREVMAAGYDFDLIDAHYFYPDGVAAVAIAEALGKPVTITARGTDINLIPKYSRPRAMILDAARKADGLITVCQALKDEMIQLGIDGGKIVPLRNGVDLDLFRPGGRTAARAKYGLTRTTLLSVGHLIPRKAHDLVIEALTFLPDADLLIAGDGPEEKNLKALTARLGLEPRVRFLGRLEHADLPELYGAADLMVLASSREGWANVLLESMACGTPVVASNVWGTPEVVAAPEAGRLMKSRTPEAAAEAATDLLANLPERAATRCYAEGFGWEQTSQGQLALFREILTRRASR